MFPTQLAVGKWKINKYFDNIKILNKHNFPHKVSQSLGQLYAYLLKVKLST